MLVCATTRRGRCRHASIPHLNALSYSQRHAMLTQEQRIMFPLRYRGAVIVHT